MYRKIILAGIVDGLVLSYCRYNISKKNKTSVPDKNDVVRGHKKAKLVTFLRLDHLQNLLTKNYLQIHQFACKYGFARTLYWVQYWVSTNHKSEVD